MTVCPIREWRLNIADGVTIAGDRRGDDAGPVVVLLHGLASTRRWWDFVADSLAESFQVVRFDHRGHGESSAPADGYTLSQLAADTIEVVDRLGLRVAVLAGHSLGAAVALAAAAARPDRAEAVACVDGGIYDPRLMFGATWPQARRAMLPARRGRVTADVLRAWIAATDLPDAALSIVAANYTDDRGGGLRLRLDASHEEQLAHDLWSQDPAVLLDSVRVPVLVVSASTGSGYGPRHASVRRAQARLGERMRCVWVRSGHDIPVERPERVAAALADLAATVVTPGPRPAAPAARLAARTSWINALGGWIGEGRR